MPITRRKLRGMPQSTRELGKLCNDLERAARRLRRMLSVIGMIELRSRDYERHLAQLRQKFTPEG